MKKEKRIKFIKDCVGIFFVIVIADYIDEHILHTDKWYVEFGIYLILFFLYELVKALWKNHMEDKKATEQSVPLDQIPDAVLAEIKALKLSGDEINAVKKVRETTGAGLLEAKQFVDRL